LEQQIERLAAEEQRLLEAASVVGTEFSAAAVAAGLDDTVESTETRCLALARRGQFIRSYGTEEWPDGTVADHYAFIHTLYRETFYNRIPESRRVRWHRQIGMRLEVGYGPQVQAQTAGLAEHFVRGRGAMQAVQYPRAAGEQAMQRCVYREAVSAHG
jgi:predicted ATPase